MITKVSLPPELFVAAASLTQAWATLQGPRDAATMRTDNDDAVWEVFTEMLERMQRGRM